MTITAILSTYTAWYPMIAAVLGMLCAQSIKVVSHIMEGDFSFERMFSPGGMPSSHVALVSGLTMAIGLQNGWTSHLFFICVVFSFIVMYDASGVRQSASMHAQTLNQIGAFLTPKFDFPYCRLNNRLGHTPFEAFMGAMTGIAMAILLY